MNKVIASAVFDTHAQAERAVTELRAAGVSDRSISVVHKTSDGAVKGAEHEKHEHDTKASGAGKGAAIGAGVGALAGLGALAIPGVGPFIALGAMAEAIGLIGSAAVTSGIVGAAAGGLSGALMNYGVDEEDARYYERRLNEGGYWVGVDSTETKLDRSALERILHTAGGTSTKTTAGSYNPSMSTPTGAGTARSDTPRH